LVSASLLFCVGCSSLWDPWLLSRCLGAQSVCRTLSLVAGELGGAGNADDTGAAARFDAPDNVAADGAGNLYVADSTSHTIRKVVVSTGTVTTIAGTAGMSGSTDGTGAVARFYRPSGVVADGADNVYVADNYNHTIRRIVVSTGAVTTIAGTAGMSGSTDGTGAGARFNGPDSVEVDGAGNLYVADFGNHTIRKLVVSTGAVTTIAGTAGMSGSTDGMGAVARFNGPAGVAADGAGNLYVADSGNHTIRKVVVSTGAVTTIASTAGMTGITDGTGAVARFYYPYGIAADGADNLYVADTGNHTIRKVVLSTGAVTTIAGTAGTPDSTDGTGPVARFNGPAHVAADGAGNLYVADLNNRAIRQVVLSTGAVTTTAGRARMSGSTDGTGAAARFYNPFGLAADGAGNLYVADNGNQTIRKVVVSTGAVTTVAGMAGMTGSTDGTGAAARFSSPCGMAADGAGNIYVADTNNHTIRKVVLSTGAVTTIAGTAGMPGSTDGTGATARFYTPFGVAADGAGNLYVADTINSTIRQVVVSTGAVTTIAGTAGMPGSTDGTGAVARFYEPFGVAADGAGNLYVTDPISHTIRKVVLSTGAVTTIAGTAGMPGSADGTGTVARLNGPAGVATDGAGNLYVADFSNHTIRKVELANAAVTTIAGIPGQAGVKLGMPGRLNAPSGVAVLPTGEIFIAERQENAILSIR